MSSRDWRGVEDDVTSSGVPNIPENYHQVRYELTAENGATRLTILQDNNATQQEQEHSEQNWSTVLDNMKKLIEQ